jgi:hypothetical protein
MTGFPLAWVSALGAMAALAVPLFGCGGEAERASGASMFEQSEGPVYRDARWGYSVRFPDSWYRAAQPVSPKLTEPREILALATFPLPRYRPTNCEAFGGSARSEMGRDDVFLTVLERGYERDSEWLDFPPRPEHFGPTDPRPGEPGEHGCGDPPGATVYWRNFSDAGRRFHTLVVIGADAPASARNQAWGILDSLRFDSDRRPTWPASG